MWDVVSGVFTEKQKAKIKKGDEKMSKGFTGFIAKALVLALVIVLVLPMGVFASNGKVQVKGTDAVTMGGFEPEIHLKGFNLKDKDKEEIPFGLKKRYRMGEVGPYLVVMDGPIQRPVSAEMAKLGAILVEYIPDFSFLVLMTPEIANLVEQLPFVVDVMVYEPAFKINPSLKDEEGKIKGFGEVAVKIVTFDDAAVLDNEIKNAQAVKFTAKNTDKKQTVVKMDRSQLAKFAYMNSVKYIEEIPEYVLMNDIAKGYMEVDDLWTLGYEGSDQVVGICDTGLDTGVNNSSMHLDFQGRIDAIYALGRSTADDPHGHGTHVAGSVLGDGARSSGQIKGMAPEAHVVFQSVLDSGGGLGGLPYDLYDLFEQSWNAGARIHTNSWGAAVNGDYNTDARSVDEFVWDNDMIILFAAGNEGSGSQTISSPGTAKNAITVGASENYRPSEGSYADDPTDIAVFSSRGPCEDGRIKPDIVAPGTWILSTRSSRAPDSSFWDTYNSYYAYMGGTSMATPLTAGAVAVARDYMQNEWGHTPSPAMMKAALINGGTDLGYGFPSNSQGWGRVNLMDSLDSKEYEYEDENYNLSTGGSRTYTYNVDSTYTPLKVTLVWTDYPGSTSASKALVNDLDLVVTAPNGTVYYGNDFTNPYNSTVDRTNNVENVFIDTPMVGSYTVQVSGYNVPNGPQPFALFSSADFGTGGSSDVIDPTVSLTAPSSGATVSGTITVSATASDNVGVTRVDFYAGSTLIGNDTTSPYSISWDTTTIANGTYSVYARAYDAAGNFGTSNSATVTVNNQISTTTATTHFLGYVSKSGTANEYFYIDVTSPGEINLTLDWASSADLDMFLYNPSGSEVARAYTLNNPETISYTASTTGRYEIRVNAYSSSANYTLTAQYPINPSLTGYETHTDYVSSSGTSYNNYYIDVTDTGYINVYLTWATSADLDIFLYNPSGVEVDRAYTTSEPESVYYNALTTGTYRVVIDAYSGSATYDVEITFPK